MKEKTINEKMEKWYEGQILKYKSLLKTAKTKKDKNLYLSLYTTNCNRLESLTDKIINEILSKRDI